MRIDDFLNGKKDRCIAEILNDDICIALPFDNKILEWEKCCDFFFHIIKHRYMHVNGVQQQSKRGYVV